MSIEKPQKSTMLNEWNWRLLQPRGFIFENGFLGEVQFKKFFKKWTFQQKSGVLFKKTPKTGLFTLLGALFKSGVALARIW